MTSHATDIELVTNPHLDSSPPSSTPSKTSGGKYAPEPQVHAVGDLEAADDDKVVRNERYDMVIPDGVDPALMPHEEVRRGLKQRHIQVRPSLPP